MLLLNDQHALDGNRDSTPSKQHASKAASSMTTLHSNSDQTDHNLVTESKGRIMSCMPLVRKEYTSYCSMQFHQLKWGGQIHQNERLN